MEQTLRYAAKALILETDGASGSARILCLKKRGQIGEYYVLPGGGQNPGELLSAALERECLEELGAAVSVSHLRYVQEYVGMNHEFKGAHGHMHFVNVYFECALLEPPETRPMQPDDGQVGLAWLEVSALQGLAFYPRVLARELAQGFGAGPKYLGDSV